ncbi:MAG: glycosyltransferase, partial [Bacteroidales bacterium]
SQKYPQFEIVVVYDTTDDNLLYLLRDFQQHYPQLKLINFTQNVNFFDEQRFSISIGIKSAEYDYVLISTADCRPTNEHYLESIQSGLSDSCDVLLSYTSYTRKNNLLNSFIRFHLFQNNLQILSFALKGKVYAASHQNMIYRKDFFLQHQGYTSFYALKTGVYDLLTPSIFTPKNVKVQLKSEAFTKNSDKTFTHHWIKKEMQYFTILRNAPKKIAFSLASYRGFTFLFFVFLFLGIGSLLLNTQAISEYKLIGLYACLLLILIKLGIQYYVIKRCMNKLHEKHFLLFIPLFEVLYLPLQSILFFIRMRPQIKKWN